MSTPTNGSRPHPAPDSDGIHDPAGTSGANDEYDGYDRGTTRPLRTGDERDARESEGYDGSAGERDAAYRDEDSREAGRRDVEDWDAAYLDADTQETRQIRTDDYRDDRGYGEYHDDGVHRAYGQYRDDYGYGRTHSDYRDGRGHDDDRRAAPVAAGAGAAAAGYGTTTQSGSAPYGTVELYGTTDTSGAVAETAPTPLTKRELRAAESHPALLDLGLLILRIGCVVLLMHGFSNLTDFAGLERTVAANDFGSNAPMVFSILVVAGQILLPVAILFGFLTRLSGLLLAVMMLFISFSFTVPMTGWFSEFGGLSFESSMWYWIAGLTLLCTGAGKFSIDQAVFGRRRRERNAERLRGR